MADAPLLGRLLWYELMTSDLAAAERFYTSVVGWTVTPFEGLPMPYSMWTKANGTPIAGAMTLPDELKAIGVPPHWMLYVGVPNLEDAVAHAERLGGEAVSPVIDVPTIGRMRTMRDPQGAAFSIYEPITPPETPDAPPELGDTSWIELMTTDSTAAEQFYTTLFGWRATESFDMGPMGVYRMFGRHLGSLGGMMTKTSEMAHIPSNWGLYFLVPEINEARDRVTANGGTVINGPMEVPGGDWVVNCLDPQGAAFSLHAKAH